MYLTVPVCPLDPPLFPIFNSSSCEQVLLPSVGCSWSRTMSDCSQLCSLARWGLPAMRAMQSLLLTYASCRLWTCSWCCHMRKVCLQTQAHLRQAPWKTEARSTCRSESMAESRVTGDGPPALQHMLFTEGIAAGCSGMIQWRERREAGILRR